MHFDERTHSPYFLPNKSMAPKKPQSIELRNLFMEILLLPQV